MSAGDMADWKSILRRSYVRDGRWVLSDAMQSFILGHTDAETLGLEHALHKQRGSSYNDANWGRGEYRQWYLAFYSAKYISCLQRALLEYWPRDSFDAGVRLLDVGVGPGTTALALMDLFDTAERKGVVLGGVPRFAAIDRDTDKLDYAYELSFKFAKACETLHGPRRWTRSVAAGSDWFVLDLADEDAVKTWASPRAFDVIVASNVYSELAPQGCAAQHLSEVLVPGVLSHGGSAIVLEPSPPNSTLRYKAQLLKAMSEISHALGSTGCGPCSPSAKPATCSAVCNACTDVFRWEIPQHLKPLFTSNEWSVSALRGAVRSPLRAGGSDAR